MECVLGKGTKGWTGAPRKRAQNRRDVGECYLYRSESVCRETKLVDKQGIGRSVTITMSVLNLAAREDLLKGYKENLGNI